MKCTDCSGEFKAKDLIYVPGKLLCKTCKEKRIKELMAALDETEKN